MKSLFKHILASVVAGSLAHGAAAFETDPQPNLLEVFSPNRLAAFVANTGIAALRTQMEIKYDYLSTDIMRGTVSVAGITVRPLLPYDRAGLCVIKIERAVMLSDLTKPFKSSTDMTINLTGVNATTACLPREAAMGMRAAGFRDVTLDQAAIKVGYVYQTGETTANVALAINKFASIDFSAAGTILPRLGPHGYPGDPAIRVSRALVSLKDKGGWQAIEKMLPENMRDPLTIREVLTEGFTEILGQGSSTPLNAVERNFVKSLMDQVEAYIREPGEITIEADLPPNGIVIEPDMFEMPQVLIGALALAARAAPLARTKILSSDMLAKITNPEGLDDNTRLELAAALLSGTGVPRAPGMVPDLLAPMLDRNDLSGQASALIAAALRENDPVAAYSFALTAGAQNVTSAVSELDRLEALMTTQVALEQQQAYLVKTGADDPLQAIPEGTDPRDLRRISLAHFSGIGAPRSYSHAYYFALLAEAAGDVGAASLRAEIDARFNARGDKVREIWATSRGEIQAAALKDWIAGNLGDRYLQN